MSALIPLAKALHAIASGLQIVADEPRPDCMVANKALLNDLSRAFTKAADMLGDQARAEASPPETCAGCGAESPAPGKRCAACGRLKA